MISPDKLPKMRYFKLLYKDEKHHGFQFKTGLNKDTNAFNPHGERQSGGLYFFPESQLRRYRDCIQDVKWIREVLFTDTADGGTAKDAQIYVEDDLKMKADKFVLGERRAFDNNPEDFMDKTNPLVIAELIKSDPSMLLTIAGNEKMTEAWMTAIGRDESLYESAPASIRENEDVCVRLVEGSRDTLRRVAKQTVRICLAAVKHDGQALFWVRKEFRTAEVIAAAVAEDADALWYLDPEQVTEELLLRGVNTNASAVLRMFPNASEAVKLKAIGANWEAYRFVRNPTAEFTEKAVRVSGRVMKYVPREQQTKKLWLLAVEKSEGAIGYLNADVLTGDEFEEVGRAVVSRNPRVVRDISRLQRKSMIIAALERSPSMITDVLERGLCKKAGMKEEEAILAAVRKDGGVVRHLKDSQRTEEVCIAAIEENVAVLGYLPTSLRTKKVCEVALKKDARLLREVPREMLTKEMCMEVVGRDGRALSAIPREMRTAEVCMRAVGQNGEALGDVPESVRTAEMETIALMSDAKALRYVKNGGTEKQRMQAVQANWEALEYVPKRERTERMCIAALLQNDEATRWISTWTPAMTMIIAERQGLVLTAVRPAAEVIARPAVMPTEGSVPIERSEKKDEEWVEVGGGRRRRKKSSGGKSSSSDKDSS